jgi:streptogramin lyase
LAIDGNGDIWVGLYNLGQYYKISGSDGSVLAGPISVSPNTPYGALVDGDGILWGASLSDNLLRLDTNTLDVQVFNHAQWGYNYGIALGEDDLGNTQVYLGAYSGQTYIQYDSATGTFSTPAASSYSVLGIATDSVGNIIAGNRDTGAVTKFAPDGSVIWSSPSQGPTTSRGTIVDSNDDVWLIHLDNSRLAKFQGSDGAPLGLRSTGQYPYTYSDATGLGLRTAFPTGTWTVVFDGGTDNFSWAGSVVTWNSSEPEGTTVTVRVRSSNDQASWSNWEDLMNGASFVTTPLGRYLQIEVTLRLNDGEVSPILYDLSVYPACGGVPGMN